MARLEKSESYLRQRIRTTLRISLSLPMTGSILPSSASAVRSTAYFWRASKPCSAFLLSTRRSPLVCCIAVLRAASVNDASLRTLCMVESFRRAKRRWSCAIYVSCMVFWIDCASRKTLCAAPERDTSSGAGS